MKPLIPFADHADQPAEIPSLTARAVGQAFFVCLVSFIGFYWVARPMVERLQVWWAEGLVYCLIPITVTFITLYRSCWHREITGAGRTGSLLLLSGLILVGVFFALGIMVSLLWFGAIAFRAGVGGR